MTTPDQTPTEPRPGYSGPPPGGYVLPTTLGALAEALNVPLDHEVIHVETDHKVAGGRVWVTVRTPDVPVQDDRPEEEGEEAVSVPFALLEQQRRTNELLELLVRGQQNALRIERGGSTR